MNDSMDSGGRKQLSDSELPSIKQISVLYMIIVITFIFIGSRVQHREFYSGVLITEFILVMMPAVIMLRIYNYDIRNVLRLNRVSILNLFLIFGIMIFTIPVVAVFNMVNLSIIKQVFGKILIQQPPVATDSLGLLVNVLVIGGSAGICEEVLFRGVIQRGFEKLGIIKAVLITAFLFGLMHVDFQKLLGTFILGALIGFIVYRTNSLFAGMFAHFCNNSLAVLVAYISEKILEMVRASGTNTGVPNNSEAAFSSLFEMSPAQLTAVVVVWGGLFLFCFAALAGLIIVFVRTTRHKVETVTEYTDNIGLEGMIWLVPPVFVIGFIYFAQGLGLLGVKVNIVDSVLRIIGMK